MRGDNIDKIKKSIQTKIQTNTDGVFTIFLESLNEASPRYSQVLLIKAEYNRVRNKELVGIISPEAMSRLHNEINFKLLKLCDLLDHADLPFQRLNYSNTVEENLGYTDQGDIFFNIVFSEWGLQKKGLNRIINEVTSIIDYRVNLDNRIYETTIEGKLSVPNGTSIDSYYDALFERSMEQSIKSNADLIRLNSSWIEVFGYYLSFVKFCVRYFSKQEVEVGWWRKINYYRPFIGDLKKLDKKLMDVFNEYVKFDDVLPNIKMVTPDSYLTLDIPKKLKDNYISEMYSYNLEMVEYLTLITSFREKARSSRNDLQNILINLDIVFRERKII